MTGTFSSKTVSGYWCGPKQCSTWVSECAETQNIVLQSFIGYPNSLTAFGSQTSILWLLKDTLHSGHVQAVGSYRLPVHNGTHKGRSQQPILPLVWCGCRTWSLTSRQEHVVWVLGRYVGPRGSKYQETGENRRVGSFTTCGWSSHGQGMWQAWVRREVDKGFWWQKLQGKVPALRPRRRWEDNT